MKAAVYDRYGPPEVLHIEQVKMPLPGEDEVRIRIRAAGVTNSDLFIRGSRLPLLYWVPMRLMLGLFRPRNRVPGLVFAGEVETAGKLIRRFRPGDRVYGLTGFSMGCYGEYTCLKETDSTRGALALMPSNLSFEEGTAAAYGGLLAFQYLEKGKTGPGQKVLIYGASGTTGTIAVQYASRKGAEVTGVCSTRNLELVKSLGARRVIDYTRQETLDSDERYDFILDAVGRAKSSPLKKKIRKALGPAGMYTSIDDGNLLLDSSRLDRIRESVEAGHIRPVLDRTYPLEEIVEAHRYVETGHKTGGVAVTI